MTESAWTKPEGSYPPYINIKREGDEVIVTIREAPKVYEGVYVCAHPRDAGPGRCIAGGSTCNNYCNMAPQNGPMQPRPLPCTHVDVGVTASMRLPFADFQSVFAGAAADNGA